MSIQNKSLPFASVTVALIALLLAATTTTFFYTRTTTTSDTTIMSQATKQSITSSMRPRISTVTEHLAGTSDAWHGKITREGPFVPERGRYHLYIGLFCPFAHRANLVRHLKHLDEIIPSSIVRPYPKGDENGWPGWKFPKSASEYPNATPDHLFNSEYMHEVYFKADPDYKGRYSVPVLWDKQTETIVNNESTELIRILTHAFDDLIDDPKVKELDFYPASLRKEIDEICGWMQRDLNSGVYRAGFSDTQEEYDKNVLPVFAALNKLEKIIAKNKGPFVLGEELTEVDLRLFPTAIRFDVIYVQHFKTNLGTIRHDYPQINNWMKGLFWGESRLKTGEKVWGFGELTDVNGNNGTVDFKHIKENYSKSHYDVNPKAITPRGPWPNVESGFEKDFGKVRVGGVGMREVVELEEKLEAKI